MNSESVEPVNSDASPFKHVIAVNFIPLIGAMYKSPGLGLGYQLILDSNYAIATNLSYKKNYSNQDYQDPTTFQFINAEVEARYKLSSFSEDGFYGGLGVATSGVKGEVEMRGVFGGESRKVSTDYQWENSIVPRVGYIWIPSSKRGFGDFSVSYEPLEEADYTINVERVDRPTSMEIKPRKMGANLTFMVGLVF